jgi:hypothetical protein
MISSIDASYIGGYRLKSFVAHPTFGTRGGILLLWDDRVVELSNVEPTEFCLSTGVDVINSSGEGDFKITMVYGPMAYNRRMISLRNSSRTSLKMAKSG